MFLLVLILLISLLSYINAVTLPSRVMTSISRLERGTKELFPTIMKSRSISKRRPQTYSEYKFVERVNSDYSKIFQMAICYPLSPVYFLYQYLVTPLLTKSPWAWASWPSSYDNEEDRNRRNTVMHQRCMDAFVKSVHFLNSACNEDSQKKDDMKEIRKKTLELVDAKSPFDAIENIEEWLYTEDRIKKKPNLRLKKVPNMLVKEWVRCFGGEGVPNIFPINQLNKGQLNGMIQSIKTEDEFLDQIGPDSLTDEELIQACQTRKIAVKGRKMKALQQDLEDWLDVTCALEDSIGKKLVNTQNRRLFLMGYHVAKNFQQDGSHYNDFF